MLSTSRSRHSGMFTIGFAFLLLVTTLATAPVGAESLNATFSVMSTQWGAWIAGDGWEGEQVDVRVTDPDDVSSAEWIRVDLDPGNPMTFGFSLSGDVAGFGEGWTVEVRDLVGTQTTRTLEVPLLTVDNVHTDDGTVHGSASDGLVFAVEACTDPLNICDVQNSVSGVEWSTNSLTVSDRNVKAVYTDTDGDRYERYFAWPSLSYQRGQSAQGISFHGLNLGQFEPGGAVQITVEAPGSNYDKGFSVVVDNGGGANLDLADKGIPPSDANGNPTVGSEWTFTARASGPDGEPIQKVLADTGLTLDTIDQHAGAALGHCSDGLVFFSLVRGAWSGGDGETQEETCTDGTWSASWGVDELDVPFLIPGTQDGDGDAFGISWGRASVTLDDMAAGLDPSLGFHSWSPEENATLEVWDEGGIWVDLDTDVVPLMDTPDPLDPRVPIRLSDFISPVPASVDGWTFRAFNATQVKVLTIESIAIDVAPDGSVLVNEFGEVTGTAPPNRSLDVLVGPGDGEDEVWPTQSDGFGDWAIGVDLSQASEVTLWMADSDGDGFSAWAPVYGAGTDTRFMASLTGGWVGFQGWTETSVTIDVDVDGFEPVSLDLDGGNGWLSLVDLGVNLAPGMTITVTGYQSGYSKTLILIDGLSITLFDPDLNRVEGTAPADAFVEIGAGNESGGCNWEVQADSEGNWIASFDDGIPEPCPEDFDLTADMGVSAFVSDEEGDQTLVELGQEGPGGGEPWIMVHYDNPYPGEFYGRVGAMDWPEGALTLTVDRPEDENPVYTETVDHFGDEYPFVQNHDTESPFFVEPGDTVTVTDGTTTKVHTVYDLSIDGIDPGEDIVSGATDDTIHEVCVYIWMWPDESPFRCTSEFVYVGEDEPHQWHIDFTTGQGDDQSVEPDMDIAAQQYDDDGDATATNSHRVDVGEGPTLMGHVGSDVIVEGMGFGGLGQLSVRVINDEACTGDVDFEEGFWIEGRQLCNERDLRSGDVIGVFDDAGGLVRDLMLHSVVITDVDADADTVSGIGTIGVPVEVTIHDPELGPVAVRYPLLVPNMATLDTTDGLWTVSFNTPPVGELDEWGEAMEIDGLEGDARQYEEDGDSTDSWWNDHSESLFLINPVEDFAILADWPAEPITVSVYDVEGGVRLAEQLFESDSPYYMFEVWGGVGDLDLVAGYHVVAESASQTFEHTIRDVAVEHIDFDLNQFEGRASPDATLTVAAGNDTDEWEMEVAAGASGDWLADFEGDLVFGDEVSGFVAEFDGPTATLIFFDARRVAETIEDEGGGIVSSGEGGVVEVAVEIPEAGEVSIVAAPATGGEDGFVLIASQITVESSVEGSSVDPLILTFHLLGTELPMGEDETTIVVFKDGDSVPVCDLSDPVLDSDFPCVSSRSRDAESGDVLITVYTLTLSTWAMGYQALVIGEIAVPAEPSEIGQMINVSVDFDDRAGSPDETIAWEWGDDTESMCTSAAATNGCAIDSQNGLAEASHTYGEPGVYTITATITNPLGSEETVSSGYVIIYDPTAGFVTGGGWINSPEGTYKTDPSLTGLATFGFVSGYRKGAVTPSGNTEFQFQTGDLNFHSSIYDWLVVTGAPTAMFKGVGTINGEDEHEFIIWAGDGEPDTFRIKIWDEDAGVENVIYDNGSDQAIGGGSIVIHTKKKK